MRSRLGFGIVGVSALVVALTLGLLAATPGHSLADEEDNPEFVSAVGAGSTTNNIPDDDFDTPDGIALAGAPTALGCNTAWVGAMVVEEQSQPAGNIPVTFSTNFGSLESRSVTDSEGTATTLLRTPPNFPGVATVTATSGNISNSISLSFSPCLSQAIVSPASASVAAIPSVAPSAVASSPSVIGGDDTSSDD